ncbi:cob(I)yrinic acid a,c-diamide adenosyltransferase [Stygiolobus azoricus]|uniref:Cob(I)yrinic acid a,c-diamide adenosyltransferase n=1 Tax=Stygiolobus azoricus TaxID=41675 RepID=A0A650CP10_9CREN|nr:cob(I)yrinic acid a,c-diamide adenosyltransferase [Stygiolobus azoricus]QGR19445.1 cob(I)yrinic acid a,c-diamide adenosyltransferase [Stygiolobus azoricus]
MFTREGDDGSTNVINKRVGKDSPLVNLLGDLDELNSYLGYLVSKLPWEDMKNDIKKVQYTLFEIGEDLSTNGVKKRITLDYVKWLEDRTVAYRKETGPVRLFVIPGGSEEASLIHITRSVCRRIERNTVKYSKELPEMNKMIITYLNRLSSLLFAMALAANKRKGVEENVYDIGKFW